MDGAYQLDRLHGALRVGRVGRQIIYRPTTTSTIDEAWQLFESAPAVEVDGAVVLADYQTAGRGRLGRTWHTPRGAGLLLSLLLVDEDGDLEGGALALLLAVAVCDAVTPTLDVPPRIKWPNDVLVDGRKLAGILIESRLHANGVRGYVVGIGINCLQQEGHFPPELAKSATSLELQSARPVDRTDVVVRLLTELERRLTEQQADGGEGLRQAWRERAEPPGHRIALRQRGKDYTGVVLDVDPSAGLVVQVDGGGVRLFDAAETTVLPL